MNDLRRRVLVVDDEANIRSSLQLLLKRSFEVEIAEDGERALDTIGVFRPDIILLDLVMPTLDGMSTLKRIRQIDPRVPVVMLTGTNTVKTAVEAMKLGANDYLSKPFEIEELTALIVRLLDSSAETGSNVGVESETGRSARVSLEGPPADMGRMVGRSAVMRQLFSTIESVAAHDATILIAGESGTGKELVARQIHAMSKRQSGPFVAINCAAIPETLIESELFGHEKGAFTSAIERRLGYCELADKGTLFLDEIGELSLQVQVKLLRFLQEQEFFRVGRSKPVSVDVRIICATNQNLEKLVAEKRFRQDLYYRINVIQLTMPTLRDRFEDIEHLVGYFVEKFKPLYGGRELRVDPAALEIMSQYPWPGNVRELENVVESLMALSKGTLISRDDLPRRITEAPKAPTDERGVFRGDIKFEDAERLFETEMIVKALRKTNYVQTRAAEILGISRRILKYKMDKLGIADQPASEQGASNKFS